LSWLLDASRGGGGRLAKLWREGELAMTWWQTEKDEEAELENKPSKGGKKCY